MSKHNSFTILTNPNPSKTFLVIGLKDRFIKNLDRNSATFLKSSLVFEERWFKSVVCCISFLWCWKLSDTIMRLKRLNYKASLSFFRRNPSLTNQHKCSTIYLWKCLYVIMLRKNLRPSLSTRFYLINAALAIFVQISGSISTFCLYLINYYLSL